MADQEKKLDAALTVLANAGFSGERAQVLVSFQEHRAAYQQKRDEIWKQYDTGGVKSISLVGLLDVDNSLQLMETFMIRVNVLSRDDAAQAEAVLAESERASLQINLGALAAAAVLLIVLSALIRRSILGPVKQLTALAGEIGAGNLQQVPAGAGGQNASVQETARIMEQMRDAIAQVTRGAQDQAMHVAETHPPLC